MNPYLTVINKSSGEYEEKHSKFIAVLLPCSDEESAAEILSRIKTENWDARHNVYAYILSNGLSRFSDDGEPHGTAGKPVFDVLNGSKIKDAILIVTRYFGGVLLGTGGLVRAYSTAAKAAVDSAEVFEMCPSICFEIECEYTFHSQLERVLCENGATIIDTEFSNIVKIKFSIKEEKETAFLDTIRNTFSAKISPKEIERKFLAVKIEKN